MNKTEVRSYLDLARYYRRFIDNIAKIASPLHTLTGNKVPFRWCERWVETFEELKLALTSAPVLMTFDPALPTSVHTDASQLGLGAVIYQGTRREKRVLAYASRCLA